MARQKQKGTRRPGEVGGAFRYMRVTWEETQEVTRRKIVWGRVTWEETRKYSDSILYYAAPPLRRITVPVRTKPEPRSSRLAGSGAGAGVFPVVTKNVSGPPLAPEIVEDNPKTLKPASMAA